MTSSLKNIFNSTPNRSRGFTLIETLIAILVLMLAISGPLTLASKGLQATLLVKDQDTAFYLAQDAVEYVRWVRDTNKLHGYLWLEGLDGTNSHGLWAVDGLNGDCEGASGCTVNVLQPGGQNAIASCAAYGLPGSVCPPIKFDATNDYFSYTSGTDSIFTRKVTVVTPVSGKTGEASITVIVTWSDQANLLRTVTVKEEIFDWQ